MKYVFVIILVIGLMVGGALLMKKKNEQEIIQKVEIGEITSLYLSYSRGYMINSNIRYDFNYDKDSNSYHATIKPYGIDEEDKLETEVDEIFKDSLKEILVKYEVGKWDGFNKSDQNVLDGDDFSFGVRFEDKTSISASGYMMWPENYGSVRDELDTLFMNIYNSEKSKENE